MKTAVGGYFELTLPHRQDYHQRALKLNSARNALRYYLARKKIDKIFLPYYICDSLIEGLRKDGVECSFFKIDTFLRPILPAGIHARKPALIVNYFGLNISDSVEEEHIIIDNSQAFFTQPARKTISIYSPRKFFGLADGGFLIGQEMHRAKLRASVSWEHYQAPLMRIELPADEGLSAFRRNERRLANEPIAAMSPLTETLLKSIDYEDCRKRREYNFSCLHRRLKHINQLEITDEEPKGPLAYPFLFNRPGLTEWLRRQRIFCAAYWPGVSDRAANNSWEAKLAACLTPLPIDHRWTDSDMSRVCLAVEAFLAKTGEEHV
ncbi:MAG: hypothetical protein ACRBF0_15775 [Calditrichia bacterium]